MSLTHTAAGSFRALGAAFPGPDAAGRGYSVAASVGWDQIPFHFSPSCVRPRICRRQISMRWTVCLLTILLSGCHGMSLFERPTAEAPPPIMPLWARYQQCLVTTDPTELALIIDQFERVMLPRTEPPSWMRAWGPHVISQPLRTAVDPQALGAACTLRAAAVMAETEHLTEARALYQRVLTRYAHPEWAYYVEQAQEALAIMQASAPAVVALRTRAALSQ